MMTRHFLRDDDLSQAENRLHAQKALLTWLFEGAPWRR
jgi:hypothetical protein